MNRSRNVFLSRLAGLAACGLYVCTSQLAGQVQFTDVTQQAGIHHVFEVFEGTFGGGAVVIDFNQDGWEDLFIAGGAAPDQLLENQGDGSFRNVADKAGLNILEQLVTQGATAADVNKDGWPDLFVTTIARTTGNTFTEAPNVLLINNRDGTFSDQSETYGIVEATFSTAASFGDVNRDGYHDLYVCNYFDNFEGQLDEFGEPVNDGSTRPARDLLYINRGGKTFVEASEAYGIKAAGLTFQGLWTDFDNDDDLDLLVVNQSPYREEDVGVEFYGTRLYRNDLAGGHHWIKIKLEGVRSESSGIGSRVELYTGGERLVSEVYGGSSHESQNSTIVHFGLGSESRIDSVIVKWSAGKRQVIPEPPVDQLVVIEEEFSTNGNEQEGAVLAIYPNPLETVSVIQFELQEEADWSLGLYNLLGARVATLQSGTGFLGVHFLERPPALARGVYLVVLQTPQTAISKRLVIW